MHVGNMAKGMVPGIAIVGGGIPLAAGMALAFKMQKSGRVVACFFGDGAVAEGAFHEGVNMAAIWDLPVIFVCENNLYGASDARRSKVMRDTRIARPRGRLRHSRRNGRRQRCAGGLRGSQGRRCRMPRGAGPVLLELLTYRRTGHSRRDPCHYQPKDGTRGVVRPGPDRPLRGRRSWGEGFIDDCRVGSRRDRASGDNSTRPWNSTEPAAAERAGFDD